MTREQLQIQISKEMKKLVILKDYFDFKVTQLNEFKFFRLKFSLKYIHKNFVN